VHAKRREQPRNCASAPAMVACVMITTSTLIDTLADRAKRLPEERQRAIAEALREMLDEPYVLSDDELAILRPALAEARAGNHLTDAETDDVLNAPWS
jgi:predicted transcriptional regulator